MIRNYNRLVFLLRNVSFFLIILLCTLPLSLSCSKWKPVHGMYVMEGRIVSEEEITEAALSDFDFFYLVAPPRWEAEDFDQDEQWILDKYVSGHQYARPQVVSRFVETAHKVGACVLCSFPGREFIHIATDSLRRERFARMAAAFADRYGYDGIELDWEHTVTPELHVAMMEALRRALSRRPEGKTWLTTALNTEHNYPADLAERLQSAADWVNLMYYDMGGGDWGRVPGHNAPLDRIRQNYSENWSQFDPRRLHIGLASYGYGYQGIAPGDTVPPGKTLSDYFMQSYRPDRREGWHEVWDQTAECPYFFAPDGSAFMTAENDRSVRAKLDWIREKGFGGIFWWEFHCDWVPPVEAGGKGTHLITDYATEYISR